MRMRTLIGPALGAAVLSVGCAPSQDAVPAAQSAPEPVKEVMTAEAQRAMTPAQVLADLKEGNLRFVENRLTSRDYLAQASATASGQFPKAILLSCVDSRVPPEIIFDQGIGDLFVARVAGNVEDVNLLGSIEFATKAAGARLVVVLGHSACGAIKGAADGVEMANLTDLLDEFDGVLEKVRSSNAGPGDSSDADFIATVVEENVRQTMDDLVSRSPILAELTESGDVAIVGGVYDLASGRVTWLDS